MRAQRADHRHRNTRSPATNRWCPDRSRRPHHLRQPRFRGGQRLPEAELLGAPHNLVRHPHMPAQAFANLWATIKAGRPWDGLVKNRTKAGNFYWVRANVTPVVENDQVTGYISIRSRPSREAIAGRRGRLHRDPERHVERHRAARRRTGAARGRARHCWISGGRSRDGSPSPRSPLSWSSSPSAGWASPAWCPPTRPCGIL